MTLSVRMKVAAAIAAALGVVCFLGDVHAQGPFSPSIDRAEGAAISTYSGIDVSEDSFYAFSGALIALNGNLSRPGFVVRAFISAGDYDYRNGDVPGGEVDADAFAGDLMIGYQGFLGQNLGWNVLIGADLLDNDLNPEDPSNPVSGSEAGFKVAGAVEIQDPKPIFWGLEGEYSTAYQTYWSRARMGYKLGKFVIGPEGVFLGDETYDTQRVGGFVNFPLRLTSNFEPEFSISGGYGFVTSEDTNASDGTGPQGFGGLGGGNNGGYLTVSAGVDF